MSEPNEYVNLVTCSAMPASQHESVAEGWWMRDKSKSNKKGCGPTEGLQTYDQETAEAVPSNPPHHGYGIPSNEPLPATPSGVAEVPCHKISTTENFEGAPAQLASGIHELDIGSGQIYKPHTDANPDLGDLIPGQSCGPYANTSTSPLGFWDISKDVPASSVLEEWTEEDLLKCVGEGMGINDHLPPITNYVSVEDVEETAATNKLQSDTGHVSSLTVEASGSLPPPLSAVGTPTIPSASERPEPSFALRDVSVIPWTDCYPDDPDKGRELATRTGVPGLQIYSVDVFTQVDATQDSHNFRVEIEPQPNDSVRASSVTDSERADESGWVKVEIETENPDQTDNV